jgi:hypothetical protein
MSRKPMIHTRTIGFTKQKINIITGLIGLRPQSDNSLVVNHLVPTSWDYFALEIAAYHGHNVTVIWDSDGSHYGQGSE